MADWLRHFRRKLSRSKDPRALYGEMAPPASVLTSPTSLTSSLLELGAAGLGGAAVASLGAFVVGGQVVADVAGCAAVLAVVVAAAMAAITGYVYAEFRSRVPRVHGSSSYEYMYCLGGEALAFLTGWLTLLQQTATAAAIARGTSQNLDAMTRFRLLNLTLNGIGSLDGIDSHVDFLGFVLLFVVMVVTAVRSRLPPQRFTYAVHVFVGVVLLFILVFGAFKSEFKLWSSREVFFEKGAEGVFAGAATMFCVFTGYEHVVTAADFSVSCVRPAVMRAFGAVLLVTFFLLASVTAMISLLAPVDQLQTEVAMVEAFDIHGQAWMRFLVGLPALIALLPALLVSFTHLVKLAYDMSCDGLLFPVCHQTVPMLNTPVVPVIIFGILCSILSMIFNLTTLVQLSSFCSIAVSLLVCVVVLALKYHPSIIESPTRQQSISRDASREYGTSENLRNADNSLNNNNSVTSNTNASNSYNSLTSQNPSTVRSNPLHEESDHELIEDVHDDSSSDTDIDDVVEEYKIHSVLVCRMGSAQRRTPTEASSVQAKVAITLFLIWLFCCAVIGTRASDLILAGNVTMITVLIFFLFLTVCSVLHLLCQPQDTVMNEYYMFVTPLGPMFPLLGMTMCVIMMLLLSLTAWIIVLTWLLFGLLVYLLHGIHHSSQQYQRVPEEQTTLISPPPPSHPRTYRPWPPATHTSVQADPITTASHVRYQHHHYHSSDNNSNRSSSRDRSEPSNRSSRDSRGAPRDQQSRRSRSRDQQLGMARDSPFDILRDEEERSHHRRNDDPMIIVARE